MAAKILVCDDENGLRQVLVNLLKPQGYNLFQAEDGASAIQTLKAQQPDLLLLDMRLPDMDGLEILAEAKKLFPSMPVVMLSGFGDVETAVGAIKKGAFDYLSKPFRVDDVKSVVAKALAAGNAVPSVAASPSAAASAPTPAPQKSAAPKKSGKTGLLIGLTAVLIALGVGGWFLKDKFLSGGPDTAFNTPYQNSTALCFGQPGKLWVADWVKESIYKHTLDDKLSVEQIYSLPGSHPTGLAFDGSNLWSSNSWESKIFKHNMDSNLSVDAEFDSPGPEPSGLFFDGVNLWICDVKLGKIFKTRIMDDTLEVVEEYASPGPRPIAFLATADAYWSADTEKKQIYKHAKDSALTVQSIYTVPQYQAGDLYISGLGYDGKSIWSSADDHSKIYKHNLKNLTEIKF